MKFFSNVLKSNKVTFDGDGLGGDITRAKLRRILEFRTESCAGLITAFPVALRESSSGDYRVPRPCRASCFAQVSPVMNFCLVRDIISPQQKRQRLIREVLRLLIRADPSSVSV